MTEIIINALSGLGMFIFGMLYMELALKEAAGIQFKTWIKKSTSTTVKALTSGALATSLLQSSSVVTLMTLSFVSAQLISLPSGIAVIFGSNLGTTATAWIVATLGFKVQIDLFALPMIGAGGLLLAFSSHSKKLTAFSKVMIGFGLLFLGLDIMKNAIEVLAQNIHLSEYRNYPLITFVAIGFILTALIQSSSAATAIVLSALFAQILTFEQSVAMVIGTNVGTTVTAAIGAIGGVPDKKRAAAAHFVFNIITGVVAFSLIPFLTPLILDTFGMENDLTIALALFHTIFNLLGIILLTPFIGLLANVLDHWFKKVHLVPTKYIHHVDISIPDAAFVALRNEVANLFIKSLKFSLLVSNVRPTDLLHKDHNINTIIALNQTTIDFDHKRSYSRIKEIEIEIVEFVVKLNQQKLTLEQSESIEVLLSSTRNSVYAAKILKDIKSNFNEFSQNDNEIIASIYDAIRRNLLYALSQDVQYIRGEIDREQCHVKHQMAIEENHKIMKQATYTLSKTGINEKT
ncbi:MAG TPA: Na/Pi cotransporter family protein, partial [Epsilonproteobacteria bacterium]|nr:Na/Pi cotransporter family protein [Campylobacterota bacterium]